MTDVYLLLGSNVGNRMQHLSDAMAFINQKIGEIKATSAIYETEAWGKKDQQAFLNQAVKIEAAILLHDLLAMTQRIEQEIGRVKTEKWGPRVIDIDILFYGNTIVNEEHLKVPHPFIAQRRFTLVPLCDLDADFVHPVLGKTMQELLDVCVDSSEVLRIKN